MGGAEESGCELWATAFFAVALHVEDAMGRCMRDSEGVRTDEVVQSSVDLREGIYRPCVDVQYLGIHWYSGVYFWNKSVAWFR